MGRFILKKIEWISHLFLIIPKHDSLNYLEWESLCCECHVTNWMKNVECDMLWEKSERCAGMNNSLNWYYWIALVFEYDKFIRTEEPIGISGSWKNNHHENHLEHRCIRWRAIRMVRSVASIWSSDPFKMFQSLVHLTT